MEKSDQIEETHGELNRAIAQREIFAKELTRTIQQFEEKVRELSVVRRIGDSLKYTREVRRVFELIIDTIIDETNAENCSLMLMNKETGELIIKAARGQTDPSVSYYDTQADTQRSFKVGEGIAGWVAEHRKPISISDISKDRRFVAFTKPAGSIRSILCLPLVIDNEVIGVVNMSHPHPNAFVAEDERLMTIVTGQVAIALNSVQIFDDLESEINERKRIEQALRESEERFRNLVETTSDLVWEVNEDIFYTYVSPTVSEILGYEPEEMIGKTPFDFMPPEEARRVAGIWCPTVASQRPFTLLENTNLGKAGDLIVLETSAHPFFDAEGTFRGYRGIDRDITERKRAEEALRDAQRELETQRALSMRSDRLRSLGEMAAGIAHELNQPLVGVRGLAEHILIALDRGWDLTEEKLRDRLTRVVEQADRMVHIIEHVRMFAREAGKPNPVPVQANDVVRSGMEMLGAQFRSHGLELASELSEGLPLVSANPFSLEEVILNLLNNARDAIEGKTKDDTDISKGQVMIRTGLNGGEGTDQQVRIEVIDTGSGIPKDVLAKVFDPFFTTKDPDKGTGLGLAISKSIVEDFGGTIQIESTPGEGTNVSIYLSPASKEPDNDGKGEGSKEGS